MPAENEFSGELDAFDSIRLSDVDTSLADKQPEGLEDPREPAGLPDPTDPVAEDPDAIPTEDAAPEELPTEPTLLDDGSLKLPDGTLVTPEQLRQWAGLEKEPDTNPLLEQIRKLEEKIEALGKKAEPPQPPEQKPIDPLTEPADWIEGRKQQYLKAGREVTWEQLSNDLALAQNHALRQQQESTREELRKLHESIELSRHEKAIETELAGLIEKYPNVQGEIGEEVLGWRLAAAEARGERDLEKVVKSAHELVPKLVMRWAESKKKKSTGVLRNMPRGGGNRQTPAPDFGNDVGAFERMAAFHAKGR